MTNKFKKLTATTALAAMLLSNTAFAATFSDVKPDNWYYSTVMKLADTGIINGTGDGSFNPNGEVGIDSFIKMLVMAKGLPVSEIASGYWAEPYLKSAEKAGFEDLMHRLYCYELSGNFRQSKTTKPITREQMAALIARALELDGVNTDTTQFDTTVYSDFSAIDKNYNTAVRSVIINGVMGGKDGGVFDPQATVTRAEAATVIARYMYPEERLAYNYTANEETHKVGDIYTDYNTWIVPTEVKVYETGQAIPIVAEVSMVYVEELGKYIYAGMPVSELESIMGTKAIQEDNFNNYRYYVDNEVVLAYSNNKNFVADYDICTPYNATFNGHSLGEAPLLLETYIPRTEFEEIFTNGGAIDMYPHIRGSISLNNIKIIYYYYTDGVSQVYLDRCGTPNGTKEHHLPTEISSICLSNNQVIQALGIN